MTGTTHVEHLFGRIAVACGYVTPDRLEQAVEVQRNGGASRHLGHILVEKGWLSEDQLMSVLAIQRERRAKEESSRPVKVAGATLGELAVALGWATWEQIHACIEEQAKLERFRLFFRLGEVMVSRRVMTVEQVVDLLGRQRVQILGCPACFSRYNVTGWTKDRVESCPKCGTRLEIPVMMDTVKVDGEIGTRGQEAA